MQDNTQENNSRSQFKVIFEASGMSPVHMMQVVALAFCIAGFGLAFFLATGPTQALVSFMSQTAWAAALGALALASPVAAWAYGRRIASRVSLSLDGKTVRVQDANLLAASHRDINLDDIAIAEFTEGDRRGEESVSPPRLEVEVRGQRGFTVPLGARGQAERLVHALRH